MSIGEIARLQWRLQKGSRYSCLTCDLGVGEVLVGAFPL